MRVVAGDFDQRVHDEEEQIFPIKSISVHEKYHYASPLSYDIALVELDQRVKFGRFRLTESRLQVVQFDERTARPYLTAVLITTGRNVRPVCLPLFDETVPPESSCIMAGWGRVKESEWLSRSHNMHAVKAVSSPRYVALLSPRGPSLSSPQGGPAGPGGPCQM